jgi:hypothetical protein
MGEGQSHDVSVLGSLATAVFTEMGKTENDNNFSDNQGFPVGNL